MGLEELKEKFQEEKEERKRRKITEMMLGESRVMFRSDPITRKLRMRSMKL